jgi:hypothetical protein
MAIEKGFWKVVKHVTNTFKQAEHAFQERNNIIIYDAIVDGKRRKEV